MSWGLVINILFCCQKYSWWCPKVLLSSFVVTNTDGNWLMVLIKTPDFLATNMDKDVLTHQKISGVRRPWTPVDKSWGLVKNTQFCHHKHPLRCPDIQSNQIWQNMAGNFLEVSSPNISLKAFGFSSTNTPADVLNPKICFWCQKCCITCWNVKTLSRNTVTSSVSSTSLYQNYIVNIRCECDVTCFLEIWNAAYDTYT